MFFTSTFLNCQKTSAPSVPIPNVANCLAVYKRTGPFYQDTAGTIAATTVGDPVKRWDDSSVNAKHLTWSTGNIPTLRSGGGITMPTGGAQLEASVTTGGSTTWTAYQTTVDAITTDLGWCWVANNPATPLTGWGPSYNSTGQIAFGSAGAYQIALTDTGALATRGLAVAGGTNTGFIGATSIALGTAGTTSFTSMRVGTFGGTFKFVGDIVNCAVYSTNDDATARNNVITYLATQ